MFPEHRRLFGKLTLNALHLKYRLLWVEPDHLALLLEAEHLFDSGLSAGIQPKRAIEILVGFCVVAEDQAGQSGVAKNIRVLRIEPQRLIVFL